MRHDFGDTKHRVVDYQALATSRFLEYFAEYTTLTLSGTTPVTVNAAGTAPGSVIVTDTTTALSYQGGVDFLEDDVAGTIARISGGAMPNPATVAVQYVVPPVTRSSLEPSANPPTPRARRRASRARHGPRLPTSSTCFRPSNGSTRRPRPKIKSARAGNILRVYLGPALVVRLARTSSSG